LGEEQGRANADLTPRSPPPANSPTPQDLEEGPLAHQNLDAGASMIIPVPAPLGGAIVVGESVVTYFSAGQPQYQRSAALRQTIVRVRVRRGQGEGPRARWAGGSHGSARAAAEAHRIRARRHPRFPAHPTPLPP
jgi:hypothetical protein